VGPYPSIFSSGVPSSISTDFITGDQIRVTFSSDGNFKFFYYDKPPEVGTFKILKDTLLVIQPDTSGFLKFCSFRSQVGFATSRLQPYNIPALNVSPINDTVVVRRISNDELVFAMFNFTKAQAPIVLSMDTLIYTEIFSTFRR
jgi:hypothetical protein